MTTILSVVDRLDSKTARSGPIPAGSPGVKASVHCLSLETIVQQHSIEQSTQGYCAYRRRTAVWQYVCSHTDNTCLPLKFLLVWAQILYLCETRHKRVGSWTAASAPPVFSSFQSDFVEVPFVRCLVLPFSNSPCTLYQIIQFTDAIRVILCYQQSAFFYCIVWN